MKLKPVALLLFIFIGTFGFSQFRFNEYSCSNVKKTGYATQSLLYDKVGSIWPSSSPDWVEIVNNNPTTTIDQILTGWYLSDDRYNLRKWQFPYYTSIAMKLKSHYAIVVYLCGHDRTVSNFPLPNVNDSMITANGFIIELHANFTLDQTKPGTTLYLTKNNGLTVADSVVIRRTQPNHSWGIPQLVIGVGPTIGGQSVVPGTNKYRLYSTPSPGQPNPNNATATLPTNPLGLGTGTFYVDYAPKPKIDPSGFVGTLPTINIADTTSIYLNFPTTFTYTPNMEVYASNDCTPPNIALIAEQVANTAGSGAFTGTFPVANTVGPGGGTSPAVTVRVIMHDASPGPSPAGPYYLDSFEAYATYITDSTLFQMPTVCVCVDTTKLFLTSPGQDSIPMIVDYFGKDRKEKFKNQGEGYVGISKIDFYNPVGVGKTRKQWQFLFRSEDEFGYDYSNRYQLFTDPLLGYSNRTDFKELIFRSASEENFNYPGVMLPGLEYDATHMRDFYNHTISMRHKLNYEAAHYTPIYMYINGNNRGIYYVKEPIDSAYTNYYFNRPRADILSNNMAVQQIGNSGYYSPANNSITHWNAFYNWAMSPLTSVHIPALYQQISDSLDFVSFQDYTIFNFLSVNADYVQRYAMWWKGRPRDTSDHSITKWRFALTNTDLSWGFVIDTAVHANLANTTPTNEPCDYLNAFGQGWPPAYNPAKNAKYPLISLWTKLMNNDTFSDYFLTRYQDLLNSALSCDSLEDHLKYVRTLFKPGDMASHVWWNLANPGGACASCDSVRLWNDALDSMNVFITQRCSLVSKAIANCFNLVGPNSLCVDVSPVGTGYVQINTLTLTNFIWNGKYFDSVLNMAKAFPYQNYVFDHWEAPTSFSVSPTIYSDSISFVVSKDACLKAIFKLLPAEETYGTPMIPTGFSPNADGNNDILNIYGTAEASNYELEVYNRWGELVFRSIDKTRGWDGKFNGVEVPVGVYAYRYNIIMKGKTYQSKGSVTLLR